MVAIVNTGHSIRSILMYNENKVSQDAAECIGEGNYPVDVEKMSLEMKLNRLLKQAALNMNVTRNSVHISLNFDPSENALTNKKMLEIANTYMEKIGFGGQPFLVYRHLDAGHPHMHITTIKIRPDGSRIDMQNIGRNQSESARKEIEESFGLVAATKKNEAQKVILEPVSASKIQYGKVETKKAISNVLRVILPSYKYTSLPELNAVLNLYNVSASQGGDQSKTFLNNGLLYHVLDQDKNAIGVQIKASSLYLKPTMNYLKVKFEQSKKNRGPFARRIKNEIDFALLRNEQGSFQEFVDALKKVGIDTVSRQGSTGLTYGLTFVDHTTKCVFNGSALGKPYSAKAIMERYAGNRQTALSNMPAKLTKIPQLINSNTFQNLSDGKDIAPLLLDPEHYTSYMPQDFKGRKKKKKRKGKSDNH